jgi:hypothetical protein
VAAGRDTGPTRILIARRPGTVLVRSPAAVSGTEPIVCAMPKAVILTVPSEASSRFAGLTSR